MDNPTITFFHSKKNHAQSCFMYSSFHICHAIQQRLPKKEIHGVTSHKPNTLNTPKTIMVPHTSFPSSLHLKKRKKTWLGKNIDDGVGKEHKEITEPFQQQLVLKNIKKFGVSHLKTILQNMKVLIRL